MFGDERASAKEISLFLVWPGLSGFRNNETVHARANVVTPPLTLVNL